MKNLIRSFYCSTVLLTAFLSRPAEAQTIYNARGTSTSVWVAPFYQITGSSYASSTGKSAAPGCPTRDGCWYRAALSMGLGKGFGCRLTGDTLTDVVYKIEVTVPTSNSSSDLIMGVSSTNGTLSVTETAAFQTANGADKWGLVGYITNNPGTLHPHIEFQYISGTAGRSYADCIKFTLVAPCLDTADVSTSGPYYAGQTNVTVTKVTNAVAVTVYQRIGAGIPVQIGQLTTGIVDGNNVVTLSGTNVLIKGAQVMATQTVGLQEGCVPSSGALVGGGANPKIRVSLDMRQNNAYSGPIGADGTGGSGVLYFMPGAAITSPAGGIVVNQSNCWQTIKIDPRSATQSTVWSGTGITTPDTQPWAAIESFVFQLNDTTDTGPFEIYIDNLANGTTIIQDWENPTNATTLFNHPNFAGFPLGMLIASPSIASVSTNNASGGTNSDFINFQFGGLSTNYWVRLVTSAGPNPTPQIDRSKPIYFDMLLLPVGTKKGHSIGTVGYLEDVTNCPGANVTWTIPASGPNPLSFQWQRNGVNIAGATNSVFTTNNVSVASSGTYSVIVKDAPVSTFTLTRSAILVVQPVVTIDNQPTTQTVNLSSPAQFSISATPTACSTTLGYQWQFNGANIPDATTTVLDINSAQLSDAGSYSVIITNEIGAVGSFTSAVVKLYVVDVNPSIGTGSGLLGQYWSNKTAAVAFTGSPALTRLDAVIDFDWTTISPDPTISSNNFNARWTGMVQPQWAQNYTFYTTTDDGARLWVNGQLLIDKWVGQGATEWSGSMNFTNTDPVPIILEYYEGTSTASAKLRWDSASQTKDFVPTTQLYPSEQGSSIPPQITLTSPLNNAVFTAPANVSLVAAVTNNDAVITKVEFYSNGTNLIATANNAPFTNVWNSVGVGTNIISARAYYGAYTLNSVTNKITVNAPVVKAVTISGLVSNGNSYSLNYAGGGGNRFVLIKSTDLSIPTSGWTRVATNLTSSGSFAITPALPKEFYLIQSE